MLLRGSVQTRAPVRPPAHPPAARRYESWWKSRRSVIWTFSPDAPERGKEVLFDRNYEDAYSGGCWGGRAAGGREVVGGWQRGRGGCGKKLLGRPRQSSAAYSWEGSQGQAGAGEHGASAAPASGGRGFFAHCRLRHAGRLQTPGPRCRARRHWGPTCWRCWTASASCSCRVNGRAGRVRPLRRASGCMQYDLMLDSQPLIRVGCQQQQQQQQPALLQAAWR